MQSTELEDRIRIHDLFVRYTFAVDSWDESALLACFTDDAILETPVLGGKFSGREGQREFARAGRNRAAGSQMRHVFSNLGVELSGDRASAQAYFVVYATRNGKSELSVVGRYECRLRKLNGEWLFEMAPWLHRVFRRTGNIEESCSTGPASAMYQVQASYSARDPRFSFPRASLPRARNAGTSAPAESPDKMRRRGEFCSLGRVDTAR
jgi:ketosteroid isomerase-like protein